MKSRMKCTHLAVLLCCYWLTVSAKVSSNADQSGPGLTTSPQNNPQKPTSQPPPTQTTIGKTSGTIDIPKFDFSVFENTKKEKKKSAIADIPTIDFSKKSKQVETKKEFCQADMCKLMDICKNNSRCVPQGCTSVRCECKPGFSGQYCDQNATDIRKAKEVQTVNGKIVTTEAPPETTTEKQKQKSITHGNYTGSIDNETSKHDITNPAEKYKQPTGSFLKGPEVPSPSSEKPIKINVKSQRIRGKSTTIIEHPSASVTIATVSVNLEQSLSGGVSGQTTKKQKKSRKNGAASDTSLKSSKNVEKVFLTSGQVKIVDQSVTPLDMTSVSKGKEVPKHV